MDWSLILASILGGGATIFSGIRAFSAVHEGWVGVKLAWGKAERNKETGEINLYGPGVKWLIPFKEKMQTVQIKKNMIHLDDLTITLKNNLTYKFEAAIIYDVINEPKHIENIMFLMESPDLFVELCFKKAIQKVLHKSEELDINKASSNLMKELKPVLLENGWIIRDVDIMLFAETVASQVLRGVDYRIEKALEYQDQLSPQLLAAAMGVSAMIPIEPEDNLLELANELDA